MEMNSFWKRLKELFDMRSELDIEAAEINIKRNTNFHGVNIWILIFAIIIASLGLNVNSTAVIIGAMLISPLMGPIIGFGLAIGTNDIKLLRSSLKNLGIMVLISVIASTLFFLISPLNMQHPSELLARTRPTIFDVLIAFVGGAAGALETSRREKGTVISGVAIATALMPPICTVGYGLAILDFKIAGGALYLFFINCVFVALATFLVVKYLGFPAVTHVDSTVARRTKRLSTVLIIFIIVPSVFSAISVIRENNFNLHADEFVKAGKDMLDDAVIYDYKTDFETNPPTLTLYMAGNRLSDTDKEVLFSSAEQVYNISRHQLRFENAFYTERQSEMEKEVYADLMKNIEDLKEQVKHYESLQLPHEQLASEVEALYPQLTSFSMARGPQGIIAIVAYTSESDPELESHLLAWLKVRLDDPDVQLVRRFTETNN